MSEHSPEVLAKLKAQRCRLCLGQAAFGLIVCATCIEGSPPMSESREEHEAREWDLPLPQGLHQDNLFA